MRPRLHSDEELLALILAAFAELGFEGASMREVCRRLGVSHNFVHERFGSKEQMWYAAVDHGFRGVIDELVAAFAEAGDDGFDQLRAVLVRFMAVTAAQPALTQIVNQESARPGPRYEYLWTWYIAPITEGGNQILRRLQAEGRVRPGPLAPVFFFLSRYGLGAMASYPGSLSRLGDVATPDQAMQLAIDVLIDGLRTPSGRRR